MVLAQRLALAGRSVIKLLAVERAADPIFLAHSTREALAASQVGHPNLVPLQALGGGQGVQHAALVHVAGRSAAEALESRRALSPHLAGVMVLQAARGLAAAHRQGLCHRDVKPANLLLGADGRVLVDDLGLEMTPSLAAALEARENARRGERRSAGAARADGSDASARIHPAAGTPAYMAPEQASDLLASDARADVYALGVTFYQLVTGRLPFPGENAVELMRRHSEEEPVPPREYVPALPAALSDVIRTMMGKRVQERYPSMAVVIDVLETALGLRTQQAADQLQDLGQAVQQAARDLVSSPRRRLRTWVVVLSAAVLGSLSALLHFGLGLGGPALGILGFGAVTAIVTLTASAVVQGAPWLRLASELLPALGPRGATISLLAAAGLLWAWSVWGGPFPWFLLICVAGLAGAFLHFLDRPLAAERAQRLAPLAEQIRLLRIRGHDEVALRAEVSRQAGACRRQLLERLFGPEANGPSGPYRQQPATGLAFWRGAARARRFAGSWSGASRRVAIGITPGSCNGSRSKGWRPAG